MNQKYDKYTGTETILFVDDDDFMRDYFPKSLESCGYKIIIAEDGQEAVEKYLQNSGSIHLVILDIVMPFKDGISTYKDLLSIHPDVKILFMSGYLAGSQDIGDLPIITKPFLPIDLMAAIRNILDSDTIVTD